MRLHLVDINPEVAAALSEAFRPHPEVQVACDDILRVARHCVVSPANSQGFMDGGVDAAYLSFFGLALQAKVLDAIARRPEGFLPVGASVAVATGNDTIPFLIVAPTMETPEEVPASHAGRALRAVLREVRRNPRLGEDVYCPGLTTHVGHVAPAEAAQSMVAAYESWKLGSVAS